MYDNQFISKKQIREMVNCPRRTFSRWVKLQQPELSKMGIGPKAQKLPPEAAKFLCNQLNIELQERKIIKFK
jgi:hypothetical protein